MSTRLVFFSDFVCPFCYVAERGAVTKLVAAYDLDFEWHGFELHPETPRGGMKLDKLFRGTPFEAVRKRMEGFAAGFGVTFSSYPDRLPNTRRALAVALFAAGHGKLEPFRQAGMDAHWNRGLDLESDDVLRTLASEVGLDPAEALVAADAPDWQARVDDMGREAARFGVTGIPTYVFLPSGWNPGDPLPAQGPKPVRLVGCQPYPTVAAAAERAGAVPRAGTPPA